MCSMDDVFQKLNRIIIAEFSIGGFTFQLSNTLLCVWIVSIILIIACILVVRNLEKRPGKRQIVVEMLVGFIINICKDNIGQKYYHRFVPYIGTLFLFLCMSNLLPVLNFIPGLNLYPPTKDINVTMPLAIMSMLVVIYSTLRVKGVIGSVKDLCRPIVIMAPFKLMEYITKPMSLCLRLFGNMIAAFIIMELVFEFIGLFAAPLSAYFDFFDGILQAYIFIFLTCIYVGEAVDMEDIEVDTSPAK